MTAADWSLLLPAMEQAKAIGNIRGFSHHRFYFGRIIPVLIDSYPTSHGQQRPEVHLSS